MLISSGRTWVGERTPGKWRGKWTDLVSPQRREDSRYGNSRLSPGIIPDARVGELSSFESGWDGSGVQYDVRSILTHRDRVSCHGDGGLL